jgi:hypothetical protein
MRSVVQMLLALAAVGGVAATTATAAPLTAKPQYIAHGDAICATAIQQTRALGVVPTMQAWGGPAGTRLLAIDHTALVGLNALTPPRADTATVRALLAGASATIAQTALALRAARAGNAASFRAHAATVALLTRRYQAGARAYGFRVCARWGS